MQGNTAVVLTNSDLLCWIISYLDPNYIELNYIDGINLYNNMLLLRKEDYCFVIVQTFKCLYNVIYLKAGVSNIRLKSIRNLYLTSLSLCEWSVCMGIEAKGFNNYVSICSLAFRHSNNWSLLQNIVVDYPDWKPCLEDVLQTVKNGNINQLEWLKSNYPDDINQYFNQEFSRFNCYFEGICSYVAFSGHLHILQWLRSQYPLCPWDESTCSYAAENGHLNVLQWLRSQDPPCHWDESTCSYAAGNCH